jgi:hypothetical protein
MAFVITGVVHCGGVGALRRAAQFSFGVRVMRDTCEICGRKPALMIKSQRHLGLILYGKTWRTVRLLCREHGEAQVNGDLAFTMLLGWWGIISVFVNAKIVIDQLAQSKKLTSLAPPDSLAASADPTASAQTGPSAEA